MQLADLPGAGGALGRELGVALALAREAGRDILAVRGGELGIELKPGDEPVTRADRAASELIVAGLHARFPGELVISEELELPEGALASAARGEVPRLWLVDPIDGTKDYIRGGDGFSVMIGLVVAGRPALGVVHQPSLDRTFFATLDGGAHVLTGERLEALAVSPVTAAADARLVASKSHRTTDIDRVKDTLGIADELNVGSVGVKLCLIAMGVRDLYVNPAARTKVWDTAAPEAILTLAGGRLTDLFGAPIDYGELRHVRGLVASNGRVHDEVVGRLGPLFEALRSKGS